jgi:hypothetical protein
VIWGIFVILFFGLALIGLDFSNRTILALLLATFAILLSIFGGG